MSNLTTCGSKHGAAIQTFHRLYRTKIELTFRTALVYWSYAEPIFGCLCDLCNFALLRSLIDTSLGREDYKKYPKSTKTV